MNISINERGTVHKFFKEYLFYNNVYLLLKIKHFDKK